jgi:hypothetical protein
MAAQTVGQPSRSRTPERWTNENSRTGPNPFKSICKHKN